MKSERFFVIGEKEIFLDKILVEFNGLPIFFVCKHNEEFYISLYIGEEEERYIVVRASLGRLSKMLYGKLTMRNLMLQSLQYWDIVAGETPDDDVVVLKDISEIPLDMLPYEGEYLEMATSDLKQYAENIEKLLYGEHYEEKMQVYFCEATLDKQEYLMQYQNILETITDSLAVSRYYAIEYEKIIKSSEIVLDKNEKEKLSVEINNSLWYAA